MNFIRILYSLLGLVFVLSLYMIAAIGRIIRIFVGIYLQRKYNQVIQFPTARDLFFMLDNDLNRLEVIITITVKGKLNLNALKEVVEKNWLQLQQDGQWTHPKLRQCLRLELGYFFWIMKQNFSVDDQFILHKTVVENMDELQRVFSEELSAPLPRDRPLWYFKIVHLSDNFPGLDPGPHSCVMYKFHHSISDGVGTIRMLNTGIFDDRVDELSPACKKKTKVSLPTFLRNVVGVIFSGNCALIEDMITRDKNVLATTKLTGEKLTGLGEPISTARIKKLKEMTGCTVNDILSSCVAGAIREYLIEKNDDFYSNLRFYFPVFMSDMSQLPRFNNNTSATFYNFAVRESSSIKRLMLTRERMNILKQGPQIYHTYYIIIPCFCFIPHFILNAIISFPKISGIFSNIPGPQRMVSINGQPVERMNVFVAIASDIGMTIGVLSLNEIVQFSLKVDTGVIKTQEEICRFLKNINNEFEKLEYEVCKNVSKISD